MVIAVKMAQIEQVLTIASEGSISKAAKKLYLSQPNLSVSLRQLERELGAPLFERSGKGVTPTAFGSSFLSFAGPAYRQFQLLGDFCTTMLQPMQQHLSVASQHLRFASILFSSFCAENANSPYEVSFLEGSLPDVLTMVRQHEAEVGLIILPHHARKMMLHMLKENSLAYHCISVEAPVAIMRKGHPLLSHGLKTVTLEMLQTYPLVMYRDSNIDYLNEVDELGLKTRQSILVRERASMYELLRLSDAYTIGTHNLHAYANTQYYDDMDVLRLSDRREMLEIGYIHHAVTELSPIANSFIEKLTRALQN